MEHCLEILESSEILEMLSVPRPFGNDPFFNLRGQHEIVVESDCASRAVKLMGRRISTAIIEHPPWAQALQGRNPKSQTRVSQEPSRPRVQKVQKSQRISGKKQRKGAMSKNCQV